MKKLLHLLIFVLLLGVGLIFVPACSDDEENVEVEVSLSVSPSNLSVSAAGESFSIVVSCNVDYTVSIDCDWLTLDSDSSGTLAFTATANTTESSRTATITITAEDASKTVSITQAGLSFSVDVTSVSVSAAGESFTIVVTCDVDYTVSVSDDWLTLDSDDSGTLSFTAAANTTEDSRTAAITISAGETSSVVEILQEGISLSVEPSSVGVLGAGGSFTVVVTCNVDYTVSMSDDWVTLDSDDSGTLSFTATANTTEDSRTTSISIIAGELYETVEVVQAGISLVVSPTSVSLTAAGGTFTIAVSCDVDYTVSVSEDWLTLDSDDSGTLSFTATANTTDDTRTASIIILAGDLQSIVEVTQEPGTINGYEYVDLGLSVMWATCNVGAENIEDAGNYYAWGEIETKDDYEIENSVTRGVTMEDFSGDATYDAATANWGSPWRMPTIDEFSELKSECTWTHTTQNGVNGYEVTGTNGNTIFLPVTGYMYETSLVSASTSSGRYWSSTPGKNDNQGYYLYYTTSSKSPSVSYSVERCFGQAIRPVTDK